MRAIVVEIRGGRAAALGTDGVVYLVEDRGYCPGRRIEVTRTRKKRWKRPLTWAACVAVLCAMATTGVYAVYEPYAVVSIDAADSVAYTLNRFDQVLEVRGPGPAAKQLDQTVRPLAHIDDAVDQAIGQFYEDGGLSGADTDGMVISVSAKGDRKEGELKEHLGKHVGEKHGGRMPPTRIVRAGNEDGQASPGQPPNG